MYEYVADKIELNVLPSLLNSLSKDGYEIWKVKELDVDFTPSGGRQLYTFLVIARKLVDA